MTALCHFTSTASYLVWRLHQLRVVVGRHRLFRALLRHCAAAAVASVQSSTSSPHTPPIFLSIGSRVLILWGGGGVEICLFPQELKVAVNIVRLWCAFFTVVPQRCDKRIKLPMSSLSLVKRDVSSKSSFLLFQFCFKKNFYVYARHHRVHSTSVADPGLPFRWGQPLPLPLLSASPPFPVPSLSTPFLFLYLSPPQL